MSECENPDKIAMLLRSHVECLLREIWSSTELVTDDDGDYPFRSTVAAAWVQVLDNDVPAVRVFAHPAVGVPCSRKMLEEVVELNGRCRWAKIGWNHGTIVVEESMHWTAVDKAALERALDAVTVVSDDIGAMLATVYGGSTPYPSPVESEDSDAA